MPVEDLDPDYRPTPRDPATLLKFTRDISVEPGYVAPAVHYENDPLRVARFRQ